MDGCPQDKEEEEDDDDDDGETRDVGITDALMQTEDKRKTGTTRRERAIPGHT